MKELQIDKFKIKYSPYNNEYHQISVEDFTGEYPYEYVLGEDFRAVRFKHLEGLCKTDSYNYSIMFDGKRPGLGYVKTTVLNAILALIEKPLNTEEFFKVVGRNLYYYTIQDNPNPNILHATCRESAINYIYNSIHKCRPELFIYEKFTEEQVEWLRSIQSNIEAPFTIDRYENFIHLQFPKLWLNACRAGWALLACRIANKRETWDNGYGGHHAQKLQKRFKEFQEGAFEPSNLRAWDGANNWRRQIDNNTF